MTRSASLIFGILLTISVRAVGAPAVTQPAGGFELREWAVFVLDGSQNTINPEGVVTSTLPSFATTHRDASAAPSHDASPVGIIRLIGNSEKPVDVTIGGLAGSFLGSWPQAEKRSGQLLWRNVKLGATAPIGQDVQSVPDDHWFARLRGSESAYLSMERGPAERFLLYDVAMPYPSPLQVKVGKDNSIEVANIGHAPLHDLMIYQPIAGSWKEGSVGNLAAVAATQTPSTRASADRPNAAAFVFADGPAMTLPSTAAPGVKPAPATAPAPTTNPSTQPALGTVVRMTPAPRPSDMSDSWKPALLKLGVSEADTGVIIGILDSNLRDSHKLVAAYLMDDAEFDRLLPLEVLPEPRSIKRVGMVIVRNADPEGGTDVDDLIAQLGDPSWAKRDLAYKALASIGSSAAPKLRAAAQSKDIEVMWRAEKLLATANKGKP